MQHIQLHSDGACHFLQKGACKIHTICYIVLFWSSELSEFLNLKWLQPPFNWARTAFPADPAKKFSVLLVLHCLNSEAAYFNCDNPTGKLSKRYYILFSHPPSQFSRPPLCLWFYNQWINTRCEIIVNSQIPFLLISLIKNKEHEKGAFTSSIYQLFGLGIGIW